MRPDERDAAYLLDMYRYASKALEIVSSTSFHEYEKNWVQQLALERALEIVGEAARKISEDFRDAHPDIPWKSVIAHRHVMAHDYGEIRQERLWKTATADVPELIEVLKPLLSETE